MIKNSTSPACPKCGTTEKHGSYFLTCKRCDEELEIVKAAAPDLLDACKKLISLLRDIGDGDREVYEHDVQRILSDAEQAVANAEGKPTPDSEE